MSKVLSFCLLGLGLTCGAPALAGGPSTNNSLPLLPNKSQALDAWQAKLNAHCAAIYGPGYMALAQSETCVRVGGRVGVSVGTSSKQNRLLFIPSQGIGAPAPTLGGPVVGVVRSKPTSGTETDARVTVDTHTPTEYGDIATHLSVGGMRTTGGYRATGPDYVH